MKKIRTFWQVALVSLLLGSSYSAQAALAIIVHPGNTLPGMTADDVAQLFLGKSGEFANGRRASPVHQNAGSAARAKFLKAVLKRDENELAGYWSRLQFTGKAQPPREVFDDAAVKASVASNPEAIGYVDGKSVDASVKVLLIIP